MPESFKITRVEQKPGVYYRTLHCDGSVYNNGKPNQKAFFAVIDASYSGVNKYTSSGNLLRHAFIGNETNNVAEYAAVIWALGWIELPVTICTDSKLVVGHQEGWKCDEKFEAYRDTITYMLKESGSRLLWIPREENQAGKFFERWQKAQRRLRIHNTDIHRS